MKTKHTIKLTEEINAWQMKSGKPFRGIGWRAVAWYDGKPIFVHRVLFAWN